MSEKIVDERSFEYFKVDNKFIDQQAKKCGWQGVIVYTKLCRHSNKQRSCFPSINTMARELSVDRKTIMKGIDALVKRGIIAIKKTVRKDGGYSNNVYRLIDKKYWNISDLDTPQSSRRTTPSVSEGLPLVPKKDTNKTNNNKTNNKELAEINSAEVIPDLLQDKKLHIQVIGLYAIAKGINFKSVKQQRSFIQRNVRAAQNLGGYELERIKDIMRYLYKNADFKWTLETVGKYIDEDLTKLIVNNHKIAII